MADTIPEVNLSCISNQKLGLSLPAGYSAYQWVIVIMKLWVIPKM
jgi:hypothetical protein